MLPSTMSDGHGGMPPVTKPVAGSYLLRVRADVLPRSEVGSHRMGSWSSARRGSLAYVLKVGIPCVLLLPLACRSPTEPSPATTVLVINATCSVGGCSPLEIRGFPRNQPQTPGGLWSLNLGTVAPGQACLTMPAADTFRVVAAETHETTYYVWTARDSLSLGTAEPGTPLFLAGPATDPFVPASAPGWRITVPSETAVSPASACQPGD
jgi:hypothetical protein